MKKEKEHISREKTTAQNKAIFLKELEKIRGYIYEACKKAKISRATYYVWTSTDPEFKEKALEIIESQKDFVENQLIQKIKEGDTTAIIFYLKTKCKDRGYSDKTEMAITIEQPLFSDDLLPKKE